MEETAALIKSCIISKKGGVPIGDLNDEFQNLVGEFIPFRRLGFSSLCALLRTIDGLETSWNEFGEQVLKINDSKIAHIDRLIRYQKVDYSKTRNKYYKQFAQYKTNSEYNDERRQRNRTVHNTNRTNRRIQDFGHRRDPYLLKNNSFHESNSFSYEEENHRPVVIEMNETKQRTSIHEPIASGQQLLGDDFFLQLAIRNLHLPIWRYKDNLALHCGLCISGQTISDCTRALRNINTISNRVVILLGSVDVYNGATCEEMIYDMTELLQVLRSKFHLSNSAITICTLPPLANLGIYAYKKQSLALFCFNNWVRSLADDASRRGPSFESYPIIDLFESFCNETYVTEYDWFQTQARRVSGTKHSYVLWNDKGRKQAMNLICKKEDTERSRSPNSLRMQ
ncbi:Maternal effect protein oskar [Formica fusca]